MTTKRKRTGRWSAALGCAALLGLAPVVGHAAYQYIISGEAENPHSEASSEAVPVDVRTVARTALETVLETRRFADAVSNTSGLDRMKPGGVIVIR